MLESRSVRVVEHAVLDCAGRARSQLSVYCPRAKESLGLEVCAACPHHGGITARGVACRGWSLDSSANGDSRSFTQVAAEVAVGSVMRGALCVHADAPGCVVDGLVLGEEALVIAVDSRRRLIGVVPRVVGDATPTAGSIARTDSIRDIAREATASVSETASVERAIQIMGTAHVRRLPVLSRGRTVVGELRDVDAIHEVAVLRATWRPLNDEAECDSASSPRSQPRLRPAVLAAETQRLELDYAMAARAR